MIVMWVNIISTIINLIMNYILIFGKLGFPSLGIKGAGFPPARTPKAAGRCFIQVVMGPFGTAAWIPWLAARESVNEIKVTYTAP